MMRKITLSIILILSPPLLYAEITLDGTLGRTGLLTGPNYAVTANLGHQVGSHLFHSFGQFNINTGESATFSGPPTVQTIISRVTGGNPSLINGTLRSTIPQADLYFLNPYGVIIGNDAQLDVSGNFHLSTADYLRLGENGRFDARYPANSLLTVAPVTAFGFLNDSPASLNLTGNTIAVTTGKTLSLIAGTLDLNHAQLSAPAGRINLASVAHRGEVQLLPADVTLPERGGTLSITNRSKIDVSGAGGGHLFIRGGQFVAADSVIASDTLGSQAGGQLDIQADRVTLSDGSTVNAFNTSTGSGSSIRIKAHDVTVTGASATGNKTAILASTLSQEPGGGAAGDMRIEAQHITIEDGAFITADTMGTGNAGNLTLIADTVTVRGFLSEQLPQPTNPRDINSKISVGVPGSGHGGNLSIEARQITLENGAEMISAVVDRGDAGTVTLRAQDIRLSGTNRMGFESAIRAVNLHTSTGNGALVQLETENLLLADGGVIMGFNHGKGTGSQITIHATGTVTLTGTSVLGRSSGIDVSSIIKLPPNEKPTTPLVAGPAGTITLDVGKLVINDGGRISSSSIAPGEFGSSQGGEIVITAHSIELLGVNPHGENEDGFGSGIYARTIGPRAAEGGKITLTTDTLLIQEGALIQSSTLNASPGGDIMIQVNDKAIITGDSTSIPLQAAATSQEEYLQQFAPAIYNRSRSGIYASSNNPNAQAGDSGTMTLHARDLVVSHHAQISSQSLGSGRAGELTIVADTLQVLDDAEMTTSAQRSSGGDIHLTVADQVYLRRGRITTSVQRGDASHNGGHITIRVPDFIILDHSNITAQAYEGRGGNIRFVADQFMATPDSLVSASSEKGISGHIVITSPDNHLSGSLTLLHKQPLKAPEIIKMCSRHSIDELPSHFIVIPYRGLFFVPGDWQSSSLSAKDSHKEF